MTCPSGNWLSECTPASSPPPAGLANLPPYLARNAARIHGVPAQLLPPWDKAYNGRSEPVMQRLYARAARIMKGRISSQHENAWQAEDPAWQTMLFTTLIFSQLALALEVRTERRSLFSPSLFSNRAMLVSVFIGVAAHFALIYLPVAQRIFGTVALNPTDLLISVSAAVAIIAVAELWKWRLRATAGR